MHKFITCFEIIWPITLFRYQWTQGDPYWEAVNLSFTFTRGDGETEDTTKVSTSPLFSEDFWLIISEHDAFNHRPMHGNANMIKTMCQNYDQKVRPRSILINRLPLQK